MNLNDKLMKEFIKVNLVLKSLGADLPYLASLIPGDNPINTGTVIGLLFSLVHHDTGYGQKELPAIPSREQFYVSMRQTSGVPNCPLAEEALKKYTSDLAFRTGLYFIYKEHVLPGIKAIDSSYQTHLHKH